MYLIIMEDSEIFKTENVTDSDKESADAGIMDIINTTTLKTYYEGEWHDLREIKNGKIIPIESK